LNASPKSEKTGLEIVAFFGAARTDILPPTIAAPKKANISRPFASFVSFAVKKRGWREPRFWDSHPRRARPV